MCVCVCVCFIGRTVAMTRRRCMRGHARPAKGRLRCRALANMTAWPCCTSCSCMHFLFVPQSCVHAPRFRNWTWSLNSERKSFQLIIIFFHFTFMDSLTSLGRFTFWIIILHKSKINFFAEMDSGRGRRSTYTAEERKGRRRQQDPLRHAERRAQERREQTEARREVDRLQTSQARAAETVEETVANRHDDRFYHLVWTSPWICILRS